MSIRVAQFGTGNVGRLALAGLIDSPRYELTGVCVATPGKVGRDAGELAGLDMSTGVHAVDSLDALLATEPDCIVYCAMGDTRVAAAIEDCRRILAAGVDVVGSAPGVLQYPWAVLPAKYVDAVENAAREGNSSLFVTGVDPGFANDLLPLALAGTCQSIERVRCTEIADYATYDGVTVMFDVMGFGKPLDEVPMLLRPGILSAAWGPAIRQLAAGLGVEIDTVTEVYERIPAPESFEVAAGRIAEGGLAAMRFEVRGMVRDRPVVIVEHITRLRDDLCPDWPRPAQQGGSYRVEITGEPSYLVDICPTSRRGDHNHAAIVAAAGRIVNSIPDVVAAQPGIRTTLDLPLVTRPGRFASQ
jgi:2,4-diaminopentanoate dehydrogenase